MGKAVVDVHDQTLEIAKRIYFYLAEIFLK